MAVSFDILELLLCPQVGVRALKPQGGKIKILVTEREAHSLSESHRVRPQCLKAKALKRS